MMNTEKGSSADLEDVVAQTLADVSNLELQISNLLKSMEAVEDITSAPCLLLPEPAPKSDDNIDNGKPEVRMGWQNVAAGAKGPRKKGDVCESVCKDGVPVSRDNDVEGLSPLDIMELCIREKALKYSICEESVFFVPVLDRCVFGMTLLNVAAKMLRKPTLEMSIFPVSSGGQIHQSFRSFVYNVRVVLKDVKHETVDIPTGACTSGILFQDSLASCTNQDQEKVMPGCEVLVTANFSLPTDFMRGASGSFTMLISVMLEGEQLFARRIPVSKIHFNAMNLDSVFKKHHTDILSALGRECKSFQMEKIRQDDLPPLRLMQKFLTPLGYENILSQRTGTDTSVEIYTSNQPSFLWGTCFKIEKYSRKPTFIRCLVTTRTTEQMQFLSSHFKDWIKLERRKNDLEFWIKDFKITTGNENSILTICRNMDSEIKLILKLRQVKPLKDGNSRLSDYSNSKDIMDSAWVEEYSRRIQETDKAFVRHMQ